MRAPANTIKASAANTYSVPVIAKVCHWLFEAPQIPHSQTAVVATRCEAVRHGSVPADDVDICCMRMHTELRCLTKSGVPDLDALIDGAGHELAGI